MIQNYIDQLAEDIGQATKRIAAYYQLEGKSDSEEGDFQNPAALEALLIDSTCKISEITGILASMLPADDLLTDEQTEILELKMESLWKAFNYNPYFPRDYGKKVPPRLRYRAMREDWDLEDIFATTHELRMDLCDSEEERCPFPGYCSTCSDYKAKYPGIIKGIFEYCDKWCEHCAAISKCIIFAEEKEVLKKKGSIEIPSEEKTQDIENRLNVLFSNKRWEEKDFGSIFDFKDSAYPPDLLAIKNKLKQHPVVLLNQSYTEKSDQWLKRIVKICRIELPRWLAAGNVEQIISAIETICWYHDFIYYKTRLAISNHLDPDDDDFDEYTNGMAKVDLIAIDRSIGAFTFLLAHIPSQRIEMTGYIEQLTGLRKDLEFLFPYAKKFIRKGLDE